MNSDPDSTDQPQVTPPARSRSAPGTSGRIEPHFDQPSGWSGFSDTEPDADDGDPPAETRGAPTMAHIGRYALKRALGVGGLGTVFEAWDPLLSRMVAVKTLQFDIDTPSRVALDALFLNEARAASALQHPHIVAVHDAGVSSDGVYIAMERLHGRDLRRGLESGWTPSPAAAAQVARRVSDALAYAHAHGVIHAGIKPANIFLSKQRQPVVLDFGVARAARQTTLPGLEGMVAGSPNYLAPEQLAGGAIDGRTDVYALGVVLYEMLTGQKAFDGSARDEITHAILHQQPKPAHAVRSTVHPALSAITARAMARNPSDRYQTAAELSLALRQWCEQFDVEHMPGAGTFIPAPGSAPIAAHGRRSLARWLAPAAIGLLAIGLAYVTWQGGRTPTAVDAAPSRVALDTPQRTRPLTPAAVPAATPAPATPDAISTSAGSSASAAEPPVPAWQGAPAAAPLPSAAAAAKLANAPPVTLPPSATGVSETMPMSVPSPAAAALTAVASPAPPTLPAATPEAAVPADPPPTPPADVPPRAVVPSAQAAKTPSLPGGRAMSAPSKTVVSTRRVRPGKVALAAAPRVPATTAPTSAPAQGVLRLAVAPWGEVNVNGQNVGFTPPLSRLDLPVGSHRVTVRNGSHPPFSAVVEVKAGQPAVVRHHFGP